MSVKALPYLPKITFTAPVPIDSYFTATSITSAQTTYSSILFISLKCSMISQSICIILLVEFCPVCVATTKNGGPLLRERGWDSC